MAGWRPLARHPIIRDAAVALDFKHASAGGAQHPIIISTIFTQVTAHSTFDNDCNIHVRTVLIQHNRDAELMRDKLSRGQTISLTLLTLKMFIDVLQTVF